MVQADVELVWAPLLLFVAVAAIVAVVVLLVVPATRRTTAQVLAVLAGLVVLAVVGFFFLATSYRYHEAESATLERETIVDQQLEAELRALRARQHPPDRATAPAPAASTTAAPQPPAATVDPAVPAPAELPAEANPATSPPAAKSPAVPEPPPPPAWVGTPPQITGGVYQIVVASGPYTSFPECQRALDVLLRRAIDEYAETRLAPELTRVPVNLALDPQAIRRLVKEEYLEPLQTSVGPMYALHALVQFDERSGRELRERYEQAVARGRLEYLAWGGGMVLAVLGTALAYLKLDLATHGAYRRRLQLAAAALILLAGAGLALARWLVPL